MINRLLEDGDGADLAWLCEEVPEADLAGWLRRHGRRKLSRRSRAFWEIVLGTAAAGRSDRQEESDLWPL